MLERITNHLNALVGFDTTNPPREIGVDHPALCYARDVLSASGFEIQTTDLGQGSVNLLARRGEAGTLVNCHLDTVPPDGGWDRNPFDLLIENGRAIGLGACDVKGAAACVLAACERTTGAAAVLLTTDEEAGSSACVRSFLEDHTDAFTGVVVSEPTGCRAVLEHRGIVSGQVEFKGRGGHASARETRSALHDAVQWGARALEAAVAADERGEGWRLNLGQVQGGTKPNMVASSARVRFGIRPPAGVDVDVVMREIRATAPDGADSVWTTRFTAPALHGTEANQMLAARLGIETAPGVDFWTEAALFGRGGLASIVFGPGDIAQAHAPGECVTLEQLEAAAGVYERLFSSSEAAP